MYRIIQYFVFPFLLFFPSALHSQIGCNLTIDIGENLIIEHGDSVRLILNINQPTSTIETIKWFHFFPLVCPPNLYEVIVKPTASKCYDVKVIDTSGCEAIDEICLGVIQEEILLYPNPVNKFLYIDSNGPAITKIEIYNYSGQIMYAEINGDYWNDNHRNIDLDYLSAGVYFVRIWTGETFITKKMKK